MFAMKLYGRKRRSFSLLISLTLLIVLFTACSADGSGGGGSPTGGNDGRGCTKVGVLLPVGAPSERWEKTDRPSLTQDIEGALSPNGQVDYDNAQGNSATQLAQAEADLARGDCILVVGAYDSTQAASIVAKAHARHVSVIAYDRIILSKDLDYYVSFDNVRAGQLQGEYIVAHHKKGDNVVMINGSRTDHNAMLFYQGVLNVLQPLYNSGELKKVYEAFVPNESSSTAQIEMDTALKANHNNIQIVSAASDTMANSVIASLKVQKLSGKVLVTGRNATYTGIHNILTGDQSMTVYAAITREAQVTADLVRVISAGNGLSSVVNGRITTADGINIPSVLAASVAVDNTNIASTVIADGYVSKSDVCQGVPVGTDGVC